MMPDYAFYAYARAIYLRAILTVYFTPTDVYL